MPLVNISILKGKSPEYIKAVTDGINSAVIETMGFPDDDRYQIVHEVEPHLCTDEHREVVNKLSDSQYDNTQQHTMQSNLRVLL